MTNAGLALQAERLCAEFLRQIAPFGRRAHELGICDELHKLHKGLDAVRATAKRMQLK